MKPALRHTRIGILMLVSQLLLVSFSFYWLRGQYNDEKESLSAILNISYKESQQVVIDSILVKHFIMPALGDSSVKFKEPAGMRAMVVTADSFVINRKSGIPPPGNFGNNAIVTIEMKSDDDTSDTLWESQKLKRENELLLRSVKLIVQHSEDSNNVNTSVFYKLGNEPDSMLFVRDFESRLSAEGFGFIPLWIGKSEDSSRYIDKRRGITVGGWDSYLPEAYLGTCRPYLLGKISPQILFAVILILLTGSAFLLAYNSMRKQSILNEMRSSFISNISHELKTPVSTVKVALEAVRNLDLKLDPAVAAEYLGMASKEIGRLEQLIAKVLDNSIIEQDRSLVRLERTNLVTLIEGAIESMKPRIEEASAKVIFNHPVELLIDADPLYLQGVIINLFDNSLKYGNGNPEIEVALSSEKDYAVIVVSDNGPGIPDQYLKRVFEKFFRLPTNDIHNVKGYGLGLSFAALIVSMHNGTIEAKNNKTGCSFIIRIPKETN